MRRQASETLESSSASVNSRRRYLNSTSSCDMHALLAFVLVDRGEPEQERGRPRPAGRGRPATKLSLIYRAVTTTRGSSILARLEHDERDLAIGPPGVVVVSGVRRDDHRPHALALLCRG